MNPNENVKNPYDYTRPPSERRFWSRNFESSTSLRIRDYALSASSVPILGLLDTRMSEPTMAFVTAPVKCEISYRFEAESTRKLTVTVNIKLVFIFLFPWLSKFYAMIGLILLSPGLKNIRKLKINLSKTAISDCETNISPTIVNKSRRLT
jgi:hypothetical protein